MGLTTDPFEPIWQIIEYSWTQSGAGSELVQAMRRALLNGRCDKPGPEQTKFALIPGLCCQAAGGDPRWADEVAAAWFQFYIAAHLMDSVQDQDCPEPWWQELGPTAALSAASGLFFSASRLLNSLYEQIDDKDRIIKLVKSFYDGFLNMCSGQYEDIVLKEPDLDRYWDIASAKSGAFFALACDAGARLATKDSGLLVHYNSFGHHIGLLIQVLDDLNEFKTSEKSFLLEQYSTVRRSLPVIYALDVYPPAPRGRLDKCLRAASTNSRAAAEAYQLIEQSGVALYLMTEMERHKQLALAALERANPRFPARDLLANVVTSLSDF